MSHIFISYSRKDLQFVEHLINEIENRDRKAWYDHKILTSDKWFRILSQAIQDSYAMIVVMSSNSEESNFVMKEILLAEKYQIPIYPLLLNGKGIDYLIDLQHFKVVDGIAINEKFFDQLLNLKLSKGKLEAVDIYATPQLVAEVKDAIEYSKFFQRSFVVRGGILFEEIILAPRASNSFSLFS